MGNAYKILACKLESRKLSGRCKNNNGTDLWESECGL